MGFSSCKVGYTALHHYFGPAARELCFAIRGLLAETYQTTAHEEAHVAEARSLKELSAHIDSGVSARFSALGKLQAMSQTEWVVKKT